MFVAVIAWSIVPTLLLLLVNTVVTFAIITLTLALFVLGVIAIALLLLCIVVPNRTGSKLLLTHRLNKNYVWHFFSRIMSVVARIVGIHSGQVSSSLASYCSLHQSC